MGGGLKSHGVMNIEAPVLASFHVTNLECNYDLSSLNLKDGKTFFESGDTEAKKEKIYLLDKDIINLLMSRLLE